MTYYKKIQISGWLIIIMVMISLTFKVSDCQTTQFPVQVSGRVINSQSGEPVASANIQVMGTGWWTVTDPEGVFEFTSIPEGSYQLKVSHVSFQSAEIPIRIQAGVPQQLNFALELLIIPLLEVKVEVGIIQEKGITDRTIIDQHTIQKSGARSVGELLVSQGGVFIKENGAAGGSQFASIRGSAANQVLVVVDGHRLNTPGWGEVDLSTIPLDAVERIEIIKGPNLEHGGDAVGGVIQIVTKSLQDLSERSAEIGGGSFGARQGKFFLSRQGNPAVGFSASLAVSQGNYRYTDRFGDTQIRQNADMHSENLFGKCEGSVKGWQLALTGSEYHVERGIPGDLDQLTPEARLEQRRREVQCNGFTAIGHWVFSGLIYGGQDAAHHRNPEAFIPLDARHTERNAGGKLTAKVEVTSRLQLDIGHESRWDGMISPMVEGDNVERWSQGSFLQGQYQMWVPVWIPLQNFQWKAAIRQDRMTGFREQWTYQTGFFWGKEGRWAYHIRGNIGTAFRAPTFTSLFWKEDVFSRGNPDLLPEESSNREIGCGINFSKKLNLQLEITRFWQDIENIILWRRGFDGRWAPYNVSRAEVDGVELSGKVSPNYEWVSIEYSGTFLEAINRSGEPNYDGMDLTYRPRVVSRLSTGFRWKGWWTNYSVQWVSRRQIRESNSLPLAAEGMGPYQVMDISVGKELALIGCQWWLQGEVRNLEDQEYRVVERAPMPGREWRVSVGIDVP